MSSRSSPVAGSVTRVPDGSFKAALTVLAVIADLGRLTLLTSLIISINDLLGSDLICASMSAFCSAVARAYAASASARVFTASA